MASNSHYTQPSRKWLEYYFFLFNRFIVCLSVQYIDMCSERYNHKSRRLKCKVTIDIQNGMLSRQGTKPIACYLTPIFW